MRLSITSKASFRGVDFILDSQSPTNVTGAVIQDHHELAVLGFGFLVTLQYSKLTYSQGSMLCQPLPLV